MIHFSDGVQTAVHSRLFLPFLRPGVDRQKVDSGMMMMMMILQDTVYLLPFLLIEPQLSTKLPRPRKKKARRLFHFLL
jgi:hypothetical protein